MELLLALILGQFLHDAGENWNQANEAFLLSEAARTEREHEERRQARLNPEPLPRVRGHEVYFVKEV